MVIAVAIIGGATRYSCGVCLTGLKRVFRSFFDAFFYRFLFLLIAIIISTLMEPSLMNAMFATSVGYFAVFCACHLSSHSTRAEERLCSPTQIRRHFKLEELLKAYNLAEY